MKPLQKCLLWMLAVGFGVTCPVQAVNLFLRSGTTTCLYDSRTDQTLQTTVGSSLAGLALTAETNTFYFYSAPLTNSALVAATDKAGGIYGVRNDGSSDFQFQASEIIYDYDPATGTETPIVATEPSGWVTVRKNGKSSKATVPQQLVGGAGYAVPAGHLLKVAVTITVDSTGIDGAFIYGAAGAAGKSLAAFPAKNTLVWPFGRFPALPDGTIVAPPSVAENSTDNIASVRDAGLAALYSWTITNGTITAGQDTREITWTAGSVGAVSLGVAIVNDCFATNSVLIIPVNSKTNQTIAFAPIPAHTYGDAPFTLTATASSGLPVVFTVAFGPATVSSNTLTIGGAGDVIVDATQAGDDFCNPAIAERTFVVAPAPLTVSGITASNKVYDQTTDVAIRTNGATLIGVFVGDSVTLDVTLAEGYFDDASVGAGKPVFIGGMDISGPSAVNYLLIDPVTLADITPKTVTGSITANSRFYDGTTAATIASRTLSGVIGADAVLLTGGTATFSDPDVGTNKTVTATGLTLGGLDAGNYALASAVATAKASIFPNQAPAFTSIAVSVGGPALLRIAGFVGQPCVVEATASLRPPSWTPIATNVIQPDGTCDISDPDAASFPARFYRTVISCD